jgi:ATP-binding cassette subfamily F protein uup
MSFTEQHALKTLPATITKLEDEIRALQLVIDDPELYTSDPARFDSSIRALAKLQQKLEKSEAEWLRLDALANEN